MRRRGPTSLANTFQDPLSMFRERIDRSSEPSTDSEGSTSNEPNSDSFVPSDATTATDGQSFPLHGVITGSEWRDAVVKACADLLGKTLEQLQLEFHASNVAPNPSSAAFSNGFEPTPRDLADYVIMSTLRTQDALAMQNAASWLFNLMDRTGSGFVLRDEFTKYTPFIGPVTDAAVAGIVFDELVKDQVRRSADQESEAAGRQFTVRRDRSRETHRERRPHRSDIIGRSVRWPHPSPAARRRSRDTADKGRRRDSSDSKVSDQNLEDSASGRSLSADLYPLDLALRYDTWKRFFEAVQDKYACHDDDWLRVKSELGIDPGELLIKSQGALDHSDVFPTLGKLYISQRYIVFMAAVGKNHYVVRLGTIAAVEKGSIPFMMRDSIEIKLETETKAARDGLLTLVEKPEKGTKDNPYTSANDHEEETMSQHVGKLTRHFMASKKPLVFSLLEFRETRKRDNWVRIISEMVAAHKLHIHLGFGGTGRAVPSIPQQDSTAKEDEIKEEDTGNNGSASAPSKGGPLNYLRSPFRHEPSPPLLAVAAHANIVRYRALRRVTGKRVSDSLIIFSFPDQRHQLINWYTESVRAHERQSGRTWIGRALAAIRENMEANDCLYQAKDSEPFDAGRLGDAIGTFAELCSPLARVVQFLNYLFQWRNPPATILAILLCIIIAAKGLVNFVPAALFFIQAAWVVETKYNWLGLGMGRAEKEDARRRRANVLEMVAQMHDVLMAAQNVLNRLNRELGKFQALFLWGCEDWQSWVAVGALCVVGFVLLIVPGRTLFLLMFFMLFFKHFLPPSNPCLRFWQTIPSRIDDKNFKKKKGPGAFAAKARLAKPRTSS
ncbi:PH-like protein [Gracilaria domingensis]|nr:PH-like protein [Gracilaria domingensis]